MNEFDFQQALGQNKKKYIHFSQFVREFIADPEPYLHTSSSLITDAIKYFGYEIVVRSGEPIISYNIFKDLFSDGTNAVFGQEYCINRIVDVVEALGRESSPYRGIVLVGPPASGKTNIIDLISMALEEYAKEEDIKLYSFLFQFEDKAGETLELHPSFMHHPILLFPTVIKHRDGILRPRQELFLHITSRDTGGRQISVPNFYRHANLDKGTLDIIERLLNSPQNANATLFDILEKYVRVIEIEFSNAQAKGIANIDDMSRLPIRSHEVELGSKYQQILQTHLPGFQYNQYQGAIVAANRGILHIHDAFGTTQESGPEEGEYKPLLMLLGSGKASIESTQTSIDSTVILTTNIEEMEQLEAQLTSSKLLDRIEKIPVNYLLDAKSEMDILRRDMSAVHRKYDIDPNLFRVAAYFSVMTRFLPPRREKFPENWSEEKIAVYKAITPEQKLFIYSALSEDPVHTIMKLPHWHPFFNEALKLGVNIFSQEDFEHLIVRDGDRVTLEQSGVFTSEQLAVIDDSFMRELWIEHYPNEGIQGISVRQLQNIMRNTIAKSDGFKVHVGTFFSQLNQLFTEGPNVHSWLSTKSKISGKRNPIPKRTVGTLQFEEGEGDYGEFQALAKVAKSIYYRIIEAEITEATVDRDPRAIQYDLRKYIQHALLAKAGENLSFSHIMLRQFSYIDPNNGKKVDSPDEEFMISIEKVITKSTDAAKTRKEISQRFLDLKASGKITLDKGKTLVGSEHDNTLVYFAQEYQRLLSHRKLVDGIGPEHLHDAFFQKRNQPDTYVKSNPALKEMVEKIIENMVGRFKYSREIALDTILFALRKHIVNLKDVIS